jgi:predicted GNAT superfamily acetyltransferase
MEHSIGLESAPVSVAQPPRGISIRLLTTIEEFAACVDMQRRVWGYADIDLTPVRLLILMHHLGGVVLGAHEGDTLVGFVNCVPGIDRGHAFWHSHMMAVHPDRRNRGIGTALKLAQRDQAVRHGIGSIQWVFDPLEAKNAYLNIAKLGAIVRRYSVDHYGVSTSSLHKGLDSDRLVAEWRVSAAATARPRGGPARRVAVPADVQALRRTDLASARHLQLNLRAQFQRNLADGFIVVGCERHAEWSDYVFERE